MYTIIVLIIIWIVATALVSPILELLILFGINGLIMRIHSLRDFCILTRDFFVRRTERKIFLRYLSTIAVPVSVFPLGMNLAVQYINPENNIYVGLQFVVDNISWMSVIYSILVTVGYAIYAWIIVSRNKNTLTKEINKNLSIINREFDFIPNQDWFNKQSYNTIMSLRSRYDKNHNIPHPQISLILSVLNRSNTITNIWIGDIEKLIETIENLKKSCDEALQLKIQSAVDKLIIAVNDKSYSQTNVSNLKFALETIKSILLNWYQDLSIERRDEVSYSWKEYETHLKKLTTIIESPWMECLYKQVMLIKGQGGMGKSHLLGNIVDKRIAANNPTIFILGSSLSEGHDLWTNILERLDVKCKKQTFFNALNNYANLIGERIQIIIDGINESKGGLEYWAKNIDEFISAIAAYSNIGVILSVRTTNYNGPFDVYMMDTTHATYEVLGFKDNLALACEYMFDSYGLTTPTWAVIDGLFKNPMWLHMYCVSHEILELKCERETHWQITENYIKGFNEILATKFQYNKNRNILQEILFAIADKMIANKKLYLLSYKETIDTINDSIGMEINASSYLNELLQLGILRQEQMPEDVVINFEYEMFGNIVVAYRLVSHYSRDQWEEFSWLLPYELTEIVPIVTDKEYWTYYDEDIMRNIRIREFIDTLPYRTSLTPAGKDLLDRLWDQKDYNLILNIICSCATNIHISYNALRLYDLLYDLSIMERDSLWTIRISEYSDIQTKLYDVAYWIMNASIKVVDALDYHVAELLGEILIWTLCSTHGKLRDTATKGLVNLLRYKNKLLINLISKYYNVNDLYITERLWGVAFGCCTQNKNQEFVMSVANLASDYVFNIKPIVEHILIRDYARLIIEYAVALGDSKFKNETFYLPPYNTYSEIPHYDDAYIVSKYEDVYKEHEDKHISASAMAILNSMAVEYSRRGVARYGDFGRYTFQYALSDFPEDPNNLSNWGVTLIFEEYHYNPQLVKWFDCQTSRFGTYDRERIGKKYQWLVLYKIAAILSDYYTLGPAEKVQMDKCVLKLRNIDPTILKVDRVKLQGLTNVHNETFPYTYENIEHKKWLFSPKYMPNVKQLIIWGGKESESWVKLYAYQKCTLRPTELTIGKPNREFWCFLQSCFLDKKFWKKATQIIDKHGLQGRCFSENDAIYHLYAGLYFWSKEYDNQVKRNGYENKSFGFSMKPIDNIMMRPTMIEYVHEYHDDRSSEDSDIIYYPNSHIIEILHLKLFDNRGVWVNMQGEIVLLDGAVIGGESSLIIRKDVLLDYLQKTQQVLIWPILIEKRLINWHKRSFENGSVLKQSGGFIVMNDRGKIKSKIRQYDKAPTIVQVWLHKHIYPSTKRLKKQIRKIGVKLHIIKLSEEELFSMRIEEILRLKDNAMEN